MTSDNPFKSIPDKYFNRVFNSVDKKEKKKEYYNKEEDLKYRWV